MANSIFETVLNTYGDDQIYLSEGAGKFWSWFFVGILGLAVHGAISGAFLDKVTQDPRFKKAINKQAEITFAHAKKENKNLTTDLPTGFTNSIRRWWKRDDGSIFTDWNTTIDKYDYYSVSNKYCFGFSYDTDSIRRVDVCFYDKARDRFVWKPLIVPDGYR